MKQNIPGYKFLLRILEEPELQKNYLKKRHISLATIEHLQSCIHELKKITANIMALKTKKNIHSDKRTADKNLGIEIKGLTKDHKNIVDTITKISLQLPNYPLTNNKQDTVIEDKKGFLTSDQHVNLKDIDLNRASATSQRRFSYLSGGVASLHRALGQFMIDYHLKNHNYKELYCPYLVNSDSLINTGQLPKFKEDLFKSDLDDLYMIPTGEVPIMNYLKNTLLTENDLDINLVSLTPCFRREAGAYGKKISGLRRQHQFDKVELVKVVRPEDEIKALHELVKESTSILDVLDLPYRVLEIGYDNLGWSAAKTYDIELKFSSDDKTQDYLEVSSCSTCNVWQSSRLNLRYTDFRGLKVTPCTLNGSGLAVGRVLLGLISRYRISNTISIPYHLQPYLNNVKQITLS